MVGRGGGLQSLCMSAPHFLFLASGGHAILTIWLSGPMATDNYNGEHATFISVTHMLQMPKQTKEHLTGLWGITKSV